MSKIEEIVEYYPNRIIKEKGTKKDGKKDGLWTYWYENGRKRSEAIYKDGELKRITDWDFYTGVRKNETHFNGVDRKGRPILDGKLTAWHRGRQQKAIVENYNNGKLHGLVTRWYENGQKEAEGTVRDGIPDGLGAHWYKNGQKWIENNYKDGKLIEKKVWDEDGNLL